MVRYLARSMRILFVLPRMVSGGVERVTLNLLASLRADRIECALALRRCRGELLLEAEGLVPVHELGADGVHSFIPQLSRLVSNWRPTHVITAFPDVALMTLLACRLARSNAALIHGVHGTHSHAAARPGWSGCLRQAANNAMAGIVYRHADALVAVSQGVGEEILRRSSIPSCRLRVIYNPVIQDGFQLRVRWTAPWPGSRDGSLHWGGSAGRRGSMY